MLVQLIASQRKKMKAESHRNREGARVLLFLKPIAAPGVFLAGEGAVVPKRCCLQRAGVVASRPAAGKAHGAGSSPAFWDGF